VLFRNFPPFFSSYFRPCTGGHNSIRVFFFFFFFFFGGPIEETMRNRTNWAYPPPPGLSPLSFFSSVTAK